MFSLFQTVGFNEQHKYKLFQNNRKLIYHNLNHFLEAHG